jgi:hypothetical protein
MKLPIMPLITFGHRRLYVKEPNFWLPKGLFTLPASAAATIFAAAFAASAAAVAFAAAASAAVASAAVAFAAAA